MKLGLFGGTFDPIHLGHLDVARQVRRILDLDAVWILPARVPPHREHPGASAAHRFAMACLAIQDQAGLLVSDVDVEAPGPSYTSGTLDRIQARGIDTATAHFIVGADAFRDITTWKDYPGVLERCGFVVVSRPGTLAAATRAALPALSARMVDAPAPSAPRESILLVDVPTPAISSTDVRQAAAAGESLDGLVPAAVASHIARHRLYGPLGPGPRS